MKNIFRGIGFFIVTVLVVLIVLDMSGQSVRKTETNTLANNAPYNAIRVKVNGQYDIDNIDELVAEVVKEIVLSKETDSKIQIQVLGIDSENGMLDINIIQYIHHVNGKITTTEERRTVILEEE